MRSAFGSYDACEVFVVSQKLSDQSRGYLVSGICIAIIFGVYLLTRGNEQTALQSERERQDEVCFDELAAYIASRRVIEANLRSPTSAEFPSYSDRLVEVRDLGNCRHLVLGYVDADNAFGANIRNYYSLIVEYQIGKDLWRGETATLAISPDRAVVVRDAGIVEGVFGNSGSQQETKPLLSPAPDPQRELIRSIQDKLQDKGFNPGPPDGRMGPRTRSAIGKFQLSNGLLVTGEPSQELLDQLSK